MLRRVSPSVRVLFAIVMGACATPLRAADVTQLLRQVQSLIGQGKYQEALPVAAQSVEAARVEAGENSLLHANALLFHGMVQVGLMQIHEAVDSLGKSVTILEKVVDPKDPTQQRWLAGIRVLYGMLLGQSDDLEGALAELTKALKAQNQFAGTKSEDVGITLTDLGFVSLQKGDTPEGGRYLQRALEILHDAVGEKSPSTAAAHLRSE